VVAVGRSLIPESVQIGPADLVLRIRRAGWHFVGLVIWDKGARRVREGRAALGAHSPLVTEVIAQYVRDPDWAIWAPEAVAGLTNVWRHPSTSADERLSDGQGLWLHPNQKPLTLFRRLISASSNPGDVVWEPFGGLASAAVAAVRLGRRAYVAEREPAYHDDAAARLGREWARLERRTVKPTADRPG
jgi:DNA modification methylase